MTGRTEIWVDEIMKRIAKRRRRYEKIINTCIVLVNMCLFTGVCILFEAVKASEMLMAGDCYGSLLIAEGERIYAVIGVSAFWLGAALTVICQKADKIIHRTSSCRKGEENM